eukprot:3882473-Pleurochrysis_carterae.AAC.1
MPPERKWIPGICEKCNREQQIAGATPYHPGARCVYLKTRSRTTAIRPTKARKRVAAGRVAEPNRQGGALSTELAPGGAYRRRHDALQRPDRVLGYLRSTQRRGLAVKRVRGRVLSTSWPRETAISLRFAWSLA